MKISKHVWAGAIGAVATLGLVSVAVSDGAGAPAPRAVAPAVADGAFKVDPVHSSVVYRVKHMDVSYFYGRFNKIEGSFQVDASDPSRNSVEVTIATDSIDSNSAGRDRHLKSQDFFSATEFPSITFKSTSWKKAGEAGAAGETAYDVVGELSLLGKTREVTARVTHTGTGKGMRGGEVGGLEAKFTIKRSDFGMNYMVGKGLGDEVTVMVGLEGGRE